LNPKKTSFKDYGGRGIKICKEWEYFPGFLKSMGTRPDGFSLERIDVNGDYCPKNCKWIQASKQARNTQRSLRIRYGGAIMLACDACDLAGIKYSTFTVQRYRRKKKKEAYGAQEAFDFLLHQKDFIEWESEIWP